MTMGTGAQLIDDYLARLDQAAQVLPPGRRADLLAEIRGHLDDARIADEITTEAGVRALLDRMGPPEEIVAAATDGDAPVPATGPAWAGSGAGSFAGSGSESGGRPGGAPRSRPSLTLEIWTVLMLTVGSIVLPVVGWLVGVVLLWSGDRWRTREKVLGTLVVPGGIGGLLVVGAIGTIGSSSSCFTSYDGTRVVENTCDQGTSWTSVAIPVVAVVLFVATLIVPFLLLHLARRRAHAELPAVTPDRAGQPIS